MLGTPVLKQFWQHLIQLNDLLRVGECPCTLVVTTYVCLLSNHNFSLQFVLLRALFVVLGWHLWPWVLFTLVRACLLPMLLVQGESVPPNDSHINTSHHLRIPTDTAQFPCCELSNTERRSFWTFDDDSSIGTKRSFQYGTAQIMDRGLKIALSLLNRNEFKDGSYRSVNTLRIGYKNQSVEVV